MQPLWAIDNPTNATPAAIEDLMGAERPAVATPRPNRCKVVSKLVLKFIMNACAALAVINTSEKFGALVESAVELSQDTTCAWSIARLIPSVDSWCKEHEEYAHNMREYARKMRLDRALATFLDDKEAEADLIDFVQTADREDACIFSARAHQMAAGWELAWESSGQCRHEPGVPYHILAQAYDKCIGISK